MVNAKSRQLAQGGATGTDRMAQRKIEYEERRAAKLAKASVRAQEELDTTCSFAPALPAGRRRPQRRVALELGTQIIYNLEDGMQVSFRWFVIVVLLSSLLSLLLPLAPPPKIPPHPRPAPPR